VLSWPSLIRTDNTCGVVKNTKPRNKELQNSQKKPKKKKNTSVSEQGQNKQSGKCEHLFADGDQSGDLPGKLFKPSLLISWGLIGQIVSWRKPSNAQW
ncbi:hypothetical protein M5D96_012274, partial [Drosophila gunungcola]